MTMLFTQVDIQSWFLKFLTKGTIGQPHSGAYTLKDVTPYLHAFQVRNISCLNLFLAYFRFVYSVSCHWISPPLSTIIMLFPRAD
jgi:hypothetical protein